MKSNGQIFAPRLDYRPVEERIKDFDEACLGFSPDTARLEASRCVQCPSPQPCLLACPLHNDIPAAMREISEGNFLKAAAIYRQTSNFPELCGRLCPDELLCESSCPVGKIDYSIRLGRLEAFVADYQREAEGLPIPEVPPPTGWRVAVVGSGPAGLTVAEELAKLGHAITVFEMRRRAGGMLVYTIPRFRLPVHIVEAKVAQLERLGVQFVFETRVGRDITVQDLLQEGYHAVLLGTGAGFEAAVNLPGVDLEGVYKATELLTRTNLDKAYIPTEEQAPIQMGERVAIFGAGHAAVDCARTAVRMGAQKVTCFYRGWEMDMLCRLEDRLAAQEEHVRFVALTEPVGLIGDEKGHVVQVQCQRVRLARRGDQSHLIPVEGSRYMVDADLVVLAPERGPDPLIVEDTPGLEIEPRGWIVSDEETGQTTRRGVFAAGDNTGESHMAVVAILEGRKVAASIHRHLSS
ncbi:MAG: FAD-dependent oxidoreductase [Anaerolineae bacterium]